MTSSPNEPPPFLDEEPPPWAARALSAVLLVLFTVAIVALFVVQVPETVSASFVLAPVRDADPVRALHPGIVSSVRVGEAQIVRDRDVLFVLASELVGDRVSERRMIDTRLAGGSNRQTNERVKYENQERADRQEQQRLEQRLTTLQRQADLKEQQLAVMQDIAARRTREFEAGLSSVLDVNRAKFDVDRLAGELEQVRTDIVDSRNALTRLTYEIAARRAAFAETQRAIGEELATFTARKSVLDQDPSRDGNAMSVAAPCAGTVVKLHVQHPGTVVHEGDLLAELVCTNEPLQAELHLPERGLALVRVGQAVKLLYDAFPYQRYGVQYGTLTWLSPASSVRSSGPGFRAFAELGANTVGVQGRPRAVLPGMTGRAAVIVGRRSLASYAIEPLRQLRESLAAGPR
ncbi:MAG TPA: HlyD family efflux transporter periplasmic adaptor subunit [Vicinamibacterales bacterium]|jgi:membrane fusion protein